MKCKLSISFVTFVVAAVGFDGQAWHTLATEANMGHRRLVRFVPGNYEKYRLDCWDTRDGADPVIRDCSLYEMTNSH